MVQDQMTKMVGGAGVWRGQRMREDNTRWDGCAAGLLYALVVVGSYKEAISQVSFTLLILCSLSHKLSGELSWISLRQLMASL